MTDEHDPITRTARRRLALLPMLAALALACDGEPATAPLEPEAPEAPAELPVPEGALLLTCTASVRAETMTCAAPAPKATPGNAAIIGGQHVNVRLSSSETSYDADAGIFGTTVTLQNLTQLAMGTSDGTAAEGSRVSFHEQPTVTTGTGAVQVANADGLDTFIKPVQPYFRYAGILAPLQISKGKRWEFDVPATVEAFEFSVFVSAPLSDAGLPLLGLVWTGAAGSDRLAPGQLGRGRGPGLGDCGERPRFTLLDPEATQPVLTANAAVLHLRVGAGSGLDLQGDTLRVLGNLDARGAFTGGTIVLGGEDAIAGGR